MFRFDPYSREVDVDPFPLYRTLRDEYPCFWSEEANIWILSRYDDVNNAVQNWETYSSSKGNLIDELPDRAGSTLGTTDPPRHDRLRMLVQAAFAKKNILYLEEPIRQFANDAIDGFIDSARFEFISDFSSRITVGTLFFLMGLPPEDHATVRENVVLSIQSDPDTHRKAQASVDAFRWLLDYAQRIIDERKKAPADDLLSRMLAAEIDGDKLEDAEVLMTSATLIIAGVESLSSFMSMFALNMHDYPDARRRIMEDPQLFGPAIEESLRFNTSAQRFKRSLKRDVELHGQLMHEGDAVALCYGSANRDERKFPNPDDYDIDRRPRGHLGFGGGKHICIGAPIARMTVELAMRELFQRVPEFHRTGDQLVWNPSTNFRGPVAIPFAID